MLMLPARSGWSGAVALLASGRLPGRLLWSPTIDGSATPALVQAANKSSQRPARLQLPSSAESRNAATATKPRWGDTWDEFHRQHRWRKLSYALARMVADTKNGRPKRLGWASNLVHRALDDLEGLHSDTIVRLLWSASHTKASATSRLSRHQEQATLATTRRRLAELSRQQLCKLGTSLARLGARADPNWLADFEAASLPLLAETNPQEQKDLLYCLAALQRIGHQGSGGEWRPPSDAWVAEFLHVSLPLLPSYSTLSLASTLWALSTLRLQPPAGWLDAACAAAVAKVDWFKPGEYAALALALAKLERHPGREFVGLWAAAVQPRLHCLSPLDLTNLLWALARLHHRPSPAWLAAAVAAAEPNRPRFKPRQRAMLLVALSQLQRPFLQAADRNGSSAAPLPNPDDDAPVPGVLLAPWGSGSGNTAAAAATATAPAASAAAATGAAAAASAGAVTQAACEWLAWDALEELPALGPREVLALGRVLALSGALPPAEWLPPVAAAAGPGLRMLVLHDLTWLLHVMAFAGVRPPGGDAWAHAFLASALPQMPGAPPLLLARLLRSLAALHIHPGGGWGTVWLAASRTTLGGVEPGELLDLLTAVLMARLRPDPPWLAEFELAVARLQPQLRPLDLATGLAVMAQFGHQPNAAWLDAATAELQPQLGSLKPGQAAKLLWALARLHARRNVSALLQGVLGATVQHLDGMTVPQLADVAAGVAHGSSSNGSSGTPDAAWAEALVSALGSDNKVEAADGASLGRLLLAMARLRVLPPPALLRRCAVAAAARRGDTSPQGLVDGLAGLVALGHRPAPAWALAHARAACRSPERLSSQGLTDLLGALAALGRGPPPPDVREPLVRAVRERWGSFSAPQLAVIEPVLSGWLA